MIPFNRPPRVGNEHLHVLNAMDSGKISGDGLYSKKCHEWFENRLGCKKALLTTSCTHALEMAALLLNIQPGDEVIMPSYTFVSSANAFVLRGACIVFVDIRKDTMNIDEKKIESAISKNTKAILVVHYAGVSCEMDAIMAIAEKFGIAVIEDAAQGMMSSYKGKELGSFGHLAAYSFHETKNFTSAGEGGLLIVNDDSLRLRAEIIREKGTDRSQFFRGMVAKYSWVDIGSSYLLNDVSAAYLWGELEHADHIISNRMDAWLRYDDAFRPFRKEEIFDLPTIPDACKHNAHMYYIKVEDIRHRTMLLEKLSSNNILGVFHYIPLHSSKAGRLFGKFVGEDQNTTRESERLIRLPLYYGITPAEQMTVIENVLEYLKQR